MVRVLALLLSFTVSVAHAVDDRRSWPVWGGDSGGTRYSELDQITPENIGDLEVAWTYSTGEMARRGIDLVNLSSSQDTPTIVAGNLVVCTPFNRIVALDPATGEERWVFDPEIATDLQLPHYNCRGVGQWLNPEADTESACAHRIFFGTNDGRMMAIDAATGTRCTDFGVNGEVDVIRKDREDWSGEWRITSAPVVINGLVVTGSIVMDNLRTDAPPGTVFALDARTGELRWSFDPIPRDPADPAYATWLDGSAERTGAANVWSTMVVDEGRDLVFVPTSSAAPDFWGGERKGDNLYSSSVVALRGSTGEVVWHFQHVHHDIWDYDTSSPPMLIDIRKGNDVIPAVVQNTKQGFVFVLNRETGEPVFGVEERPVPQWKLAGEWLSPTQPVPVKPESLVSHDLKPEDAWGFTFWDRRKCAEKIAKARYEGMFTAPDTGEGTLLVPGYAGGMNWGGPAYDPLRQWMVVNLNNVAQVIRLVPRKDVPEDLNGLARVGEGVMAEQRGTPYALQVEWLLSPFGAPCNPPPWGELVAVDMADGEIVWRSPLGSIEDDMPLPLRWDLGQPNVGGPVITAGGLIFIGAARDRIFRAFNLETGEEVWRQQMEAGTSTTPMTYEVDGRQYVVIVTGHHLFFGTRAGDKVVAFTLPKKKARD